MRQVKREIRDKQRICAMLDMFDTLYLGLHDTPYPYVVPLNFGYKYDDKLYFYIHTAKAGHKVDLIAKNPNVSVTLSAFQNFPDHPYKGHIHDFRSVMAYGRIEKLGLVPSGFAYGEALRAILKQCKRAPTDFAPDLVEYMDIYQIVCEPDQVFGKAEIVPETAQDVPFADVYAQPVDDTPIDDHHVLDKYK